MTIQQRLKRLEEKVSSRKPANKRKLKESGDISLEEYFSSGETMLPHRVKVWQEDQEYIDYLVENQVYFSPNKLLEIHIFTEVDDFLENPTDTPWPCIEEYKGKIKLSSAYGYKEENYVICDKAYVAQ